VIKPRSIIILEGPDGGGKSTLGREMANRSGALLTHLGPFRELRKGIARFYAEAMMPAILGAADVIMDRSWLSEPIYGHIYRNGLDRVEPDRARILERLAMRCRVVVVRCMAPYEEHERLFLSRKGEEMLADTTQLRGVYDLYDQGMGSHLHVVDYDRTTVTLSQIEASIQFWLNTQEPHPLNWPTAGNLKAPIALVGEEFAYHQPDDCLYQWPFGSLSGGGCSRWLAKQLDEGGIHERLLFWVNSDAPAPLLKECLKDKIVISLGYEARTRLEDAGIKSHPFHHPQYWKRFHHGEEYLLPQLIRKIDNELV
jgi:hypothetical protein